MKRGLVTALGIALVSLLLFAVPVAGHTGSVSVSQDCSHYAADVALANNVTADRTVVVSSTIPGTVGSTSHHDTTGNSGDLIIWHADGPAVRHGTVTLDIYDGDTLEFTASATLPIPEDCAPPSRVAPHAHILGPCGDPMYAFVLDNSRSTEAVTFHVRYRQYSSGHWYVLDRTVGAHQTHRTTWKHVLGNTQMTVTALGHQLASEYAADPGHYGPCPAGAG